MSTRNSLLSNVMSNRRIQNEIKKMKEKKMVYIPQENVVHISLSHQRTITLKNLAAYPFQPPKIFLDHLPYKRYLVFASLRLQNAYKKWYSHSCCLQCESFECPHRWNVFCTFQDILNEVSRLFQRKKLTAQLVVLETFFETNHLPIDILEHVVKYLYVS